MAGTNAEQSLALVGTFVHCTKDKKLDIFHNAAVIVQSGKIVTIRKGFPSEQEASEWASEVYGRATTIKSRKGEFFFPGFIDTHIHAPQYPNAGLFGSTTLLDWLQTYTFPMEASMSDLAKARRVYSACVKRTLAHGTTTASYFATIDVEATNLLADLCLKLGQRALVGRVCMDASGFNPDYYRDETAEQGLQRSRHVVDYIRSMDKDGSLVQPILTPRFAPSCSAESMSGLGQLAKELDLPIQTHISENTGECDLVAELFPGSGSYAEVYERHGLLTGRTILAHGIHLDSGEAGLIRRKGSKISHCPCSNSSLTSGTTRVRWLWDEGIDVGLGTDVSGGYSASILDAARQAAMVSRHVAMGATTTADRGPGDDKERSKLSVEEVLFLATRGGARVVGMEDRIGGFEEGMEFDAQLVGLGKVDEEGSVEGDEGNVAVFGWESWEEMVAKWLYNGDDRNTKRVWVKGREVHTRKA